VRIHYESVFQGSDQNVEVAFNLRNNTGALLTCFGNIQTGKDRLPLYSEGYFECIWPKVNLRAGAYLSTVFVAVDGDTSDWLQNAFQLQIEDGNFFGTGNLIPRDHGDLVFDHSWSSAQRRRSR